MGRKPLSEERKYGILQIRLTEPEREELNTAAAAAGVPTSTWLRDLGLFAARAAVPVKKPARKKAT